MSGRVALIDIGASNAFNVAAALERLELSVIPARSAADVENVDAIVLPGVANFGFAAEALQRTGLRTALRAAIAGGTPYLGICVGMQLLFEGSDESPGSAGLGVLHGRVRALAGPKSPHIGWNFVRWNDDGVAAEDGWAYFAHSYAPPADVPDVAAVSEYGASFAAACRRDNVVGYQFHPERSGAYGRALLQRFFARTVALHAR